MESVRLTIELYVKDGLTKAYISDDCGGSGIEVNGENAEDCAKNMMPYIEDYMEMVKPISLDPTKPVRFGVKLLNINGNEDINSRKNGLRGLIDKYDGVVVGSYWDGKKDGEAFLLFEIPYNEDNVKEVVGRFGIRPHQD